MAVLKSDHKYTEFISHEIFDVSKTENCELATGKDAKEGDIVVCSADGDWSKEVTLGKVVRKGSTKLPKGHADGAKGDLFILPFNKQKLRGKKKLEGCAQLAILLFELICTTRFFI